MKNITVEFEVGELQYIRDVLGDTIDVMEDTLQDINKQDSKVYGDKKQVSESLREDIKYCTELLNKIKGIVPINQ